MAFEDRCSPNQANSPGPVTDKVPSSTDQNCPSPNDRPLKPYTCNTITPKHERIAFQPQNMAYKRPQYLETPKDNQSPLFYHSYLNGFFSNGIPRALDYSIPPLYEGFHHQKVEDKKPKDERGSNSAEQQPKLTFSITNILRPEFGSKKPNITSTNNNISYKPYDLSKCSTETPKPLSKSEFAFGTSSASLLKRPDSANSSISTSSSSTSVSSQPTQNGSEDSFSSKTSNDLAGQQQWPAWVYCTRYSDRPSSGPRTKRSKKNKKDNTEDKRPRTAFSGAQLARLKHEFAENRYLTEKRRQQLSAELGLNEAQIKIWFQNKRAKIKKSTGQKNPLAIQLMAQGLYNHSTASCSEDEEEIKVT